MDDDLTLDQLTQDLVTLWQSEFTAMAADREIRESWAALLALWAQSISAAARQFPHDLAPGSARTAQPPGAAPAAAASEHRLGEVEQLERRVAELEQLLAERLRGGTGPGPAEGGI
jgi:hypothetical protein